MTFLKVVILLVLLLVLAFPFLPLKLPFCLCFYNHAEEKRLKNLINLAISAAIAALVLLFAPYVVRAAKWFCELKWVAMLLNLIPSNVQYGMTIMQAVVVNVLYCALVLLVLGMANGIRWTRQLLKEKLQQWRDSQGKKLQQTQGTPVQTTEGETAEEEFPQHLLPLAEEKPVGSKIVVEKDTPADQTSAAQQTVQQAQTKAEKTPRRANRGVTLRAALQQLWELFYTKVNSVWYANVQSRNVAKHLGWFIVLTGILYLAFFALLMLPVLFRVSLPEIMGFAEDAFYTAMDKAASNCYLVPSVALVCLVELYWVLNGAEAPDVTPAGAAKNKKNAKHGYVVDLDALEQELMQVYGGQYAVRSFRSGDVERHEQDNGSVDPGADPELEHIASFLKGHGIHINCKYLEGIQALQNGKDVLFPAPLYTAAGMYLYPWLNMRVLHGEHLLVICRHEGEIPNVIRNLKQGFAQVSRTEKPLWKVVSGRDLGMGASADVLVVSPRDFCDRKFFVKAKDFLKRVTVALLPDADRVVMANNYLCQILSQRLVQETGRKVQYVFLATRNTLNLDNALVEFFLLTEKPYCVSGDYAYGDVRMYIWKERDNGTVTLDNAAQTLLTEVGISNIANKHRLSNISLVSEGAIYTNQVNSQWLDTYDLSDHSVSFSVTADDGYNLPGLIYAYSRYTGKDAAMLHVITEPYMLRDYFYAHAERYLYERPLMEQSIAEHADRRKSEMIVMLCRLMEGVELEEFISFADRMFDIRREGNPVFSEIQDLVERFLSAALDAPVPVGQEHFTLTETVDAQFEPVTYIRVREDYDVLSPLLQDTELIRMQFEDRRPDVELGVFKKMLTRRYLPGQILVHDHQNYIVRRIDPQKGVLTVDDANVVHGIPDGYVQCRNYTVQEGTAFMDACTAACEGKPNGLGRRLEMYSKDNGALNLIMVRSGDDLRLRGETTGFIWMQADGGTMNVKRQVIRRELLDAHEQEQVRRELDRGLYLCLELGCGGSDRLTMTVAVMLQEFMKTLMPELHHCISVCPILEDPEGMYSSKNEQMQCILSMYPRFSGWKKPRKNCLELLIVDDCDSSSGALELLSAQGPMFMKNVFWMLDDYLKWLKEQKEPGYLHFGMEHTPNFLDLSAAQKVFAAFAEPYVRQSAVTLGASAGRRCEFCGDTLQEEFLWQDKTVCRRCAEEYVPNGEETAKILEYAVKWLTETFRVALPQVSVKQESYGNMEGSSSIDLEAGCIHLTEELPLTVVHLELVSQVVRMWQHINLDMTGEDIFEGHVAYTAQQYLTHLQQHQRKQIAYRRAMAETDAAGRGFCSMISALSKDAEKNSFVYMFRHYKKGSGTSAVIKTVVNPPSRVDVEERELSYYFYEQLEEKYKPAYDRLYKAYLAMETDVVLPGITAGQEVWEQVTPALHGDHTEMFWLNRYAAYETVEAQDGVHVHIEYSMDAETRAQRQKELDIHTAEFLEGITPQMGDYEIALKLYERMVAALDYDTLTLNRQEKENGQKRNKPDDLRSCYGALVNKKCVCAGYARGYQYLLQKCGIQSMYITSRQACHAWNVVKMEGAYYHVDVTWGDPSDTDPTRNGEYMRYRHFGLTDQEIEIDRPIAPGQNQPPCTSNACNYFVREGLFICRYDHSQIGRIVAQRLKDPSVMNIQLRFSNRQLMHTAEEHLVKNGGIREFVRMAGREEQHYRWYIDSEDLCVLSIMIYS